MSASVPLDRNAVYVCLSRFQRFKFKVNLYKLREERAIKPSTFGRLVSATLYEKRCGEL